MYSKLLILAIIVLVCNASEGLASEKIVTNNNITTNSNINITDTARCSEEMEPCDGSNNDCCDGLSCKCFHGCNCYLNEKE